jgi:hypothetical protein
VQQFVNHDDYSARDFYNSAYDPTHVNDATNLDNNYQATHVYDNPTHQHYH